MMDRMCVGGGVEVTLLYICNCYDINLFDCIPSSRGCHALVMRNGAVGLSYG